MANGTTKQRDQGGMDKDFYNINRKFVVTPFASARNSSSIRTRSTYFVCPAT